MNIRRLANDVMKLSYRVERTSKLLHWILYWIARGMHSINAHINSRRAKRRDLDR